MLSSLIQEILDVLASLISRSITDGRSGIRHQILIVFDSLAKNVMLSVVESARKSQATALARLPGFLKTSSVVPLPNLVKNVEIAVAKFLTLFKKRLLDILHNPRSTLGSQLYQQVLDLGRDLAVSPTLSQDLIKVIGSIDIIGKDRKTRTYQAHKYIALAEKTAEAYADRDLILLAMRESEQDLVIVSPEPSAIGDYCDAYAGKVFSVSGTSDFFPALSDTPNSGPPFHPWCSHTLLPYLGPTMALNPEERESLLVDEEYLLKDEDDSPARILKSWRLKHGR